MFSDGDPESVRVSSVAVSPSVASWRTDKLKTELPRPIFLFCQRDWSLPSPALARILVDVVPANGNPLRCRRINVEEAGPGMTKPYVATGKSKQPPAAAIKDNDREDRDGYRSLLLEISTTSRRGEHERSQSVHFVFSSPGAIADELGKPAGGAFQEPFPCVHKSSGRI